MKKLLVYMSMVMGSAAMLHADMTSSVTEWLLEGDAEEVCPKIGNWGRALGALPAKTKDAVLYKCENVFLGLGKTKSDDYEGNRAVHPRAWYAVLRRKPASNVSSEEVRAELAAGARRAYLKANRKQMLAGRTLSAGNQKVVDDAMNMIAGMKVS